MRWAPCLTLALVPLFLAHGPSATAQDVSQSTIYLLRYIELTPDAESRGIGLLKQLADTTRKDQGVQRFEILQRIAPTNHFLTFEIWKDKAALDAHLASAQ